MWTSKLVDTTAPSETLRSIAIEIAPSAGRRNGTSLPNRPTSTTVARRVSGDDHENTLRMRWIYEKTLYGAPGATLDDLREAVTTLEEIERIARRVLGGAHPTTTGIDDHLRNARTVLSAREAGHRVIFTDAVV